MEDSVAEKIPITIVAAKFQSCPEANTNTPTSDNTEVREVFIVLDRVSLIAVLILDTVSFLGNRVKFSLTLS